MKRLNPKLQAWVDARHRHRLSHAQVQMARELGLNPAKLGKLDNRKQERWKLPLSPFIEHLYFKRFGQRAPEMVTSIEDRARLEQQKREARRFAEAERIFDRMLWLNPSDNQGEGFPVDRDALAVAAGESGATASDRIPMVKVLEDIPVSEMRALLARVAEGDGPRVMAGLNRLTCPRARTPAGPAMTCTEFAARTIEVRQTRCSLEASAAAEKRKREEVARKQHLASVMQRADTIWAGLDALIDQKIASAYDQAAAQLHEMRDAHAQAGKDAKFQEKLAAFRARYARRSARMRRIENL